ncbi:MAG: plastocyanin/azurin family copper-binding protein [Anaerolineaceae bacterium]
MNHRVFLSVPVVLLLGFAAACAGDGTSKTAAPASSPSASGTSVNTTGRSLITIQVADNTFTPSNLTVPMGTKVTWEWGGGSPHSVAGNWQGAAVQSQQFSRAGSFEFTFETAGTFTYQCGVHGAAMAGKVTVKP